MPRFFAAGQSRKGYHQGALRDDATRQIRDEIGSKLFAQPIDMICVPVQSTFCFVFLLANDFPFLSCDIFHQGDIQGTYDAIDKESFTQTDRQVRSNTNSLQGPSRLQYFTVTTRATRRTGRGGKNGSELFAPLLILLQTFQVKLCSAPKSASLKKKNYHP